MCIGAAKSGTTSLYDILRQHSDIFLPSFKEPHFFDIPSNYEKGIKWYRDTYFSRLKAEKSIGDFTPTYLFDEDAPQRIYNDLGGGVKFIVILRNPVDRAYSHYLHSKRDEHESLTFIDALCLERNRVSKKDYLSYLRFSYIGQGMYGQMLKRYLRFFPKENFLIINFEQEFLTKRKETIDRIISFLELDIEDLVVNLASNRASIARSIWLKRLMKRTGIWRKIFRYITPSLKVRQIIRNKIQRLNLKEFTPEKIGPQERESIFNIYFKSDVMDLESLFNKQMHWGK
jgi:hypothetical protein